jgi:DNA-binding NtrC family response regulator
MAPAVLVIEHEVALAGSLCSYLERNGFVARHAESALQGFEQLDRQRPDAVVLASDLPGIDGLDALQRITARDPALPVLMLMGGADIETAVQAMRRGAFDILTKPVALAQLRQRLQRALGESGAAHTPRDGRCLERSALDSLIGDSEPMRALKASLATLIRAERQLRDTDAPAVLLLGETGTGKELVARALHDHGARAGRPFVELNCAALPAQLLESELFGHERGAFTDARARKLGLVETAEGGTLFLDEIGDMDLALQAKLLKLLEEKSVRRLGAVREQKVDVRIVAATHRPLEELVRAGRFRADLYYRLRVVQLRLPPLRERGGDIALLARHFVAVHAARYGKRTPVLGARALAALLAHRWPGNVRELRNLLEQAVLLGSSATIEAQQLAIPGAAAAIDAQADAPRTLPEVERFTLARALDHNGWNVSRAARALGISRDTLRYRIDKHGLTAAPRFADRSREACAVSAPMAL